MNSKVKRLVVISIFTALTCVLSPISFYIGPIPFSLSLFIILIVNSVFNRFEGIFITLLYILLGCLGLPIFAGGMAGISAITGPTGGYIIGYFICSIIVSLISFYNNKSNTLLIVSYILGTLLVYVFGVIHFINLMDTTLKSAVMLCVYPFIIFDTIKICLAFLVTVILKNKLLK